MAGAPVEPIVGEETSRGGPASAHGDRRSSGSASLSPQRYRSTTWVPPDGGRSTSTPRCPSYRTRDPLARRPRPGRRSRRPGRTVAGERRPRRGAPDVAVAACSRRDLRGRSRPERSTTGGAGQGAGRRRRRRRRRPAGVATPRRCCRRRRVRAVVLAAEVDLADADADDDDGGRRDQQVARGTAPTPGGARSTGGGVRRAGASSLRGRRAPGRGGRRRRRASARRGGRRPAAGVPAPRRESGRGRARVFTSSGRGRAVGVSGSAGGGGPRGASVGSTGADGDGVPRAACRAGHRPASSRSGAEQLGEPGATARAARLHGADGAVEDRGGLGDRVALHVDQHQRGALLVGQRAQGVEDQSRAARRGRRGRPGRRSRRSPTGASPRSPRSSRSSGSASVRRTFAARRRSRQALTTTRCSQVVTAASPRKVPARRYAATRPSWRPSAASSRLPMVRSATAQSRSRWRAKSTPNASRVAGDVGGEQVGVAGLVGGPVAHPRTVTSATSPRNPSAMAGSEVSQTVR